MSQRTRWLRRLGWTALGFYLAYALLGNLFLNSALADRALNRKPDRFHAQWQRGVTWWPGQVRLWDVKVKGQARRVQWSAQAVRVRTSIALLPLLWRELKLNDIDSDELQFDSGRVATDLKPAAVRPGGWVIHLARIHSDTLRRARWENVVAEGQGEVVFGLVKQLRGGALEILPSTLKMASARVVHANDVVLSKATLDARFEMPSHRADEVRGLARLALIRVALQLQGDAAGLALTLGSDDKLDIALQPGGGRADALLAFEQGELQPGGRVALDLPVSFTDPAGVRRENRFTIDAAIDEQIGLRVVLPAQPQGVGSLDANLHIASRRLPLEGWRELLPQTSGEVALRWRFESLRWLSDMLVRSAWLSFDGAGELVAALKIDAGRLADGSHFEVPGVDLSVHVLDDRIRGHARAVGTIVAPATGKEVATAHVELALDQFSVASDAAPDKVYVQGRALKLDLESSGNLAEFRESVNAHLRFDDASIPDLTAYNHFLPGRQLRFTGGSGRLNGDVNLDAQGKVARGHFGLQAKRAALAVADLTLSGDVAIDTRLTRADLEGRRFDLAGSNVTLRNVGYAQGDEARSGWWTTITMPRSRVQWGRPLQLDGEVEAKMKDVGFLLALFARNKTYPKWVLRLIDAGQATARGQARIGGGAMVLDRLHAQNERFQLRGRLKLEDASKRGDLLLSWGALDVGVELRDTERKLHLLKATEWFEKGPNLLPAAAAR